MGRRLHSREGTEGDGSLVDCTTVNAALGVRQRRAGQLPVVVSGAMRAVRCAMCVGDWDLSSTWSRPRCRLARVALKPAGGTGGIRSLAAAPCLDVISCHPMHA